MPTIAEYLKFANLQMAAEALYGYEAVSLDRNQPPPVLTPGDRRTNVPITVSNLTTGNLHASKFTAIEAAKFVDPVTGWKVVEHISNTTTGFSGTLFKNNQTGELVLSFRSTEFIDDAARDNQATNQLEIAQKGWAFGQLSDMENWYQSLKSRNLIDGQLSVTGYSLGGHLATAFNLMHGGEALGPSMPMLIKQVITFNGAGVGSIGGGSAADIDRLLPMVRSFSALRAEAEETGLGRLLQTDLGRTAYQSLKSAIYANGGAPSKAMVGNLFAQFNRQLTPATQADYLLLNGALGRILDVYNEAHRVTGLSSGGNPPNPANIPDTYVAGTQADGKPITRLAIAGESLDYQLVVLVTARDFQTTSLSYVSGALAAIGPKVSGPFGLANQFDVVGTEMADSTVYDMVSHSQYHYGQDVQFFIEDQPLTRGSSTMDEVWKAAQALGARLLTDNYANNDFGDTHSLVLLVDSLSVMNVIDTLAGGVSPETIVAIFKAATAKSAERTTGTQGKAEGDALEMVVDALASILTGTDRRLREGALDANGKPLLDINAGNTWADSRLRTNFHDALATLTSSAAFKQLANKLQFLPAISSDGSTAKSDFAQFLSLYYLAPFQLKVKDADATAIALLKQANEPLAQAWEADAALTTEERAAGKASFSDTWLSDRASMATWKAIGNTDNKVKIDRSDVTGAWDFEDTSTGKKIGVQQFGYVFTDSQRHKILFGSDTTDSKTGGIDALTGNAQIDHLFGMSGIDLLQGKGGDDWIEGGKDADVLIGGAGNDILNGGQGLDSYVWTSDPGNTVLGVTVGASNDGNDWIIDSDKVGRLLINGAGLKLLIKQTPTTWTTPDGKVALAQTDGRWKLAIDGGGSLDLGTSFSDSDYGIYRLELPTATVPTKKGDLKPDSTQPQPDADGNVIVTSEAAPGRADTLNGNSGNDYIQSLAGNDFVMGKAGHDLLEGGSGSDVLIGDDGNDTAWGEASPGGASPIATALASSEADANQTSRGDWVDGQAGNDILVGTAARDLLTGGSDHDLLIGGAGDDLLLGDDALQWVNPGWDFSRTVTVGDSGSTYLYHLSEGGTVATAGGTPASGNDALYGGRGADWLIAGGGDDLLDGGSDNDVLFGDGGNDIVLGGSGNDYLNGDASNVPDAQHGADWLDGGAGEDTLNGNGGDDVLLGGADKDTLYGGAGSDILDGGEGIDILNGDEGADLMLGGAGEDTLYGGAGRDTYVFNKGDGRDTVYDKKADGNILRFGAGISEKDINLHLGSLMLDLGNGDEIHLRNIEQKDMSYAGLGMVDVLTDFNRLDVFHSASIGSFEFADGSTLTTAELLQRGFDLDGTDGDDTILGTNTTDRIRGLGGNDILVGEDGDDVLDGGIGNDQLNGAAGNDSYLFNRGGGQDLLDDEQGTNTLRLGSGIVAADLSFSRSGMDLALGIAGTADQITLKNWGARQSARIATLDFADGTQWTAADLTARIPPVISGAAGADLQQAWFDQDTRLQGQAGNDTLIGNAGNDWLDGGVGNDLLIGGAGADVFVLKLGAGRDEILDADYRDGIVFGAGIDPASIIATRSADGLRLSYGHAGDSVLIRGASYPDELRFADGSGISLVALFAVQQSGYAVTGDSLGQSLADTRYWATTFVGSGGDDTILAGGSNTTHRVYRGDGRDNLVDLAGIDTLVFGAGIGVADIRFAWEDRGDYAPKFKVYYGDNDAVAILNGEHGVIEKFRFDDGTTWSFGQLAARQGFTPPAEAPGAGVEIQPVWGHRTVDALYVGTPGNDTLTATNENSSIFVGGQGDDRITLFDNDGSGHNRLVFNAGDGDDTISIVDTDLVFGGGINPTSLTFAESTRTVSDFRPFGGGWVTYTVTDLTIGYGTQGDSIRVEGELDARTQFEFADGRHFGYHALRYRSWGSTISGITYQYASGSGSLVIDGSMLDGSGQPIAAVAFGAGITPDNLSLGLGSLLIRVGEDGDELHIADFNPNDVYAPTQIQDFQFADGSTLSYRELVDLGFDLEGTAQDDLITGTNATDRIDAHEGDDTLSGGAGNDVLAGGAGNDSYLFGHGDGVDRIYDYDTNVNIASLDTVSFAAAVNPADVEVRRNGEDLELHLAGSTDALILSNWYLDAAHKIEQVRFADGTEWDAAELLARVPILPIMGTEGDDTLYSLGGVDTDLRGMGGNDALIGSGVGDSLDGGAGADTLEGGTGDDTYVVDELDTVVESADAGIDTVVANFDFSLEGTALENLTLLDGALSGHGNAADNVLQGNAADNVLDGMEGDDKLVGGQGNDHLQGGAGNDRYVFRLGDGVDVIDDWQGHDTLFIGNSLTAADIAAERVGDDLLLTIKGTADSVTLAYWFVEAEGVTRLEFSDGGALDHAAIEALALGVPLVAKPIVDQLTEQDAQFSFAVPADAFVDPNVADTLSYEASMVDGSALPAWLVFDALTQTFSGTPANSDVGSLNLRVTATDNGGLGAASTFVLNVLDVNDAPTVVAPLSAQSVTVGEVFEFTLPGGTISASVLDDASDVGTPDSTWTGYDQELYGSGGNDTYTFARGDGNVYVGDWDNSPMDTVQFTDVLPADVAVTEDQWGAVILSVAGTADSLTMSEWQSSDQGKIEQVVFADGTVWGVSEIVSMVPTLPTTDSDYFAGTDGNDSVTALAGDDGVHGGAGNDMLLGGAGHDVLTGDGGSDILSGGTGDDEIEGDGDYVDMANDLLAGGEGEDYIEASISNDLLIGGPGDDDLSGDDGNDVLLFNRGDGNEWYYSNWSENGVPLEQRTDTVSLGRGIAYADLSFSRDWDDLILNTGDGESITFSNWFDASWQDNKAIGTLQVIAEGMADYDPNSADPLLRRRVQQFDFVGLANRFEADLAADPTIVEWQIAPHLTNFSLGASDTSAIGGDMAYLYGKNGNLDGLTEAELRAQLGDVAFGTASQYLTKTALASGGSVFDDVDFIHGDSLTYSATLAAGAPLPAWLAFDAASGTFSGTPANSDAGVLSVAVVATDTGGLTATSVFDLDVIGLNTAPIAVSDMIAIREDDGIATVLIADLLTNDSDPDAGDRLRLDGFDSVSAQGNAIGRDAAGDLVLDIGNHYQSLAAGQTATDSFGYTIADAAGETSDATVEVAIAGVNDAPVVAMAIAAQQSDEDAPYSFTVPANTFTDIDNGDTLSYSAKLADGSALPPWLSFDPATQTLSGTPVNDDVGTIAVTLTATDADGAVATQVFVLDVANTNDAPIVGTGIAAVQATEDSAFGFVVPPASFKDVDVGDTLTLSASLATGAPLPAWLNFDAATQTFSGMPLNDNVGAFSVTVVATDEAGASVSQDFVLSVANTNDAPEVADAIAAVAATEDSSFAYAVPATAFKDIDAGDALTLSAALSNGAPLPAWLTFDAATGSFSGTPLNNDVGALSVSVSATDAAGTSASQVFALTIANTNDAPTVGAGIAVVQATEDSAFGFIVPVGVFSDVDVGDTLAYTATLANGDPLPTWLVFDPATRTFSGTPVNGDVGGLALTVTATDEAGSVARQVFALNVANTNDAPNVGAGIAAAQATEDSAFAFIVPVGAFSDADVGDTLTFSASLATGAPLPAWLNFDAATRTFSGTPLNDDVGALSVSVVATDAAGTSASQVFALTVANTNDAPIVGAGIAAVQATEDSAFGFVVPATAFLDADVGDTLTFSASLATGAPLPAWLVFDPATRTFSGTPLNENVGSLGLAVTATDISGASASSAFNISVANTNDAPVLAAPLSGVQINVDAPFSWNLPAGTFVDPDAGDVLGYSASLADGSPLPVWLSVDVATGALTGTPGPGDAGGIDIRVTATDRSGAFAAGSMRLTVASAAATGQTLIGTRQADTLRGTAYDDVFDGRAGVDTLIGLGGNDLYLVTDKKDRIVEQADEGFDTVWADTDSYALPDQVEGLALIGGADYAGKGNGLGNLLVGNRGDNRLSGLAGDDILRGLAGDDSLLGGAGLDALDGGAGEDVLEDGAGAGFIAGGRGDDSLRLGGGADVLAFNRGDGEDRVEGGDGQNDTLSLGDGIRIGDMRLKKHDKDLIVDTGSGDSLRFDGWYKSSGSRSVATLQVASNAGGTSFERYDFAALVRKFDSVLAANKRLDSWTPGSDAARFKLGDATGDVAGGSLAAAYASSGTLAELRPETVSVALATPRSDATESDGLPAVPLPPQPACGAGPSGDHDGHGNAHHGNDGHQRDSHGDARHDNDGRHDRDSRFGWQGEHGPYLTQREVEAAWQSWQQQAGATASSPPASPIDYAMGWARLRDKLAGHLDEDDWGGAWCVRTGEGRQDGFPLTSSGPSGFVGGGPIGLPGAGLKPFEGLKEGFDRLHGS